MVLYCNIQCCVKKQPLFSEAAEGNKKLGSKSDKLTKSEWSNAAYGLVL